MLSTLDAIVQVVEFTYSAMKSYAATPEGQAHIDKISADLGIGDVNSPDTQPLDMSGEYVGASVNAPRVIRP